MRANSILDTIGETPHVRLRRLFAPRVEVWVKLERANPGGSIKDRIALSMVEDAEARGLLAPGSTIIEPTSGNTGIGLAMVAAAKGYPLVLVMPESMSIERRRIMTAYGATLVLTPREQGMKGAIERARALQAETPGGWMPQQFDNPANIAVHQRTTAKEILEDFPEGLDYLITGVGTGGHITGVAEILKPAMPGLKVFAVEPVKSPVISGGAPRAPQDSGHRRGVRPGEPASGRARRRACRSPKKTPSRTRPARHARRACLWASRRARRSRPWRRRCPGIPDGARVLTFCYDTGERYLSVEGLFPA